MNRAECKSQAKQIMKGQWIIAFIAILIYAAIVIPISIISFGIGTLLFSSILLIALYNIFIYAYHTKEYKIENMTKNIKEGLSNKIVLSVLKTFYIFLWSLLFIIPGIVKKYSYYLAEFIARDNPDMDANQCLKESERLMNGHKWEIFILELSFIGWMLLSSLTFGILLIWVVPYMLQTTIIYIDQNIYKLSTYENIKQNNENIIDGDNLNNEQPQYKYCPNCGKQLRIDSLFCDSCGSKQ